MFALLIYFAPSPLCAAVCSFLSLLATVCPSNFVFTVFCLPFVYFNFFRRVAPWVDLRFSCQWQSWDLARTEMENERYSDWPLHNCNGRWWRLKDSQRVEHPPALSKSILTMIHAFLREMRSILVSTVKCGHKWHIFLARWALKYDKWSILNLIMRFVIFIYINNRPFFHILHTHNHSATPPPFCYTMTIHNRITKKQPMFFMTATTVAIYS